ncbi:MAG TPA: HEAT repeat domain-containing protein [Nitrospirota bacterium]
MAENIGPGPPDEEAKAALERIEKLVPLAKDIVLVLVKTLRAAGMYLPNNPVYKKFHEELSSKFAVFFEEEDSLSFRVRRFELEFMGRQVYHNPDREANIALMFFKDGVREVSFHKGVDDAEIKGFIDILKRDTSEYALDDDLVTLMWEGDFGHITYTVVDDVTMEETSEEEALLSFGGEEPEALRQIDALRAAAAAAAPAPAPTVSGAGSPGWPVRTGPAGEAPGAVGAGHAVYDYDSIRGTYNAPGDMEFLTELTDIFYEILITETDMERFGTVSESLTRALDIFVSRGDLALATILVMKVQELKASGSLSEASAETIDKVLDRASSGALIGKVGEFIEQTGQDSLESAGSYLLQLDERAAGPLVGLLETLSGRASRRTVCDILTSICNGSGRCLTPFIRHKYWYVARNIAMVLGKVGDAESVRQLGLLLKHEDARVRKEAIGALAAIGAVSVELVAGAFEDKDKKNRVAAARALAELDPARAFHMLSSAAAGKLFSDREFGEKKEILELLGQTGGERSVPILSGIFAKTGLFRNARRDELRAAAAYGLAAAGTDEAARLLGSESASKDKALRAACAEGLKRIDRRRG